jgi:GntR family transcriptional regulator, sialic acid-inducible nan operon repressor
VTEMTPVVRRKLSHEVFEQLLARINRGDYAPGTRLPAERQLMEMFRVGRPAVREALQDLQRLGLVEITHGEGARVIQPTPETVLGQLSITVHHILSMSSTSLAHLKDARTFFEVGMVRRAAALAKDDDIRDLESIIKAMELSAKDFGDFMKYDIAFHRRIAETTGNPIFVAVSEAILQWLSRYHVGVLREVGRESRTLDEHRHILNRIAAHDVEGAAAAMLVHQTRAADLYRPPGEVPERVGSRQAESNAG